ncbi:MAG: hypothetical protein KJ025_04795 [Burkholderiales bacterium]|nr:hypothetical protein [Burkholderiales bacterium]
MKLSSLAVAIAALALAGAAVAHTDEYLDTVQAPNGGQLRMAGSYHYELVVGAEGAGAQERTLVVYVTDHGDAKLDTAGAEGGVVILSQGKKTKADLRPDGENRLRGVATFAPAPDMKVVVAVRLAGQPPAQARFVPLKPRPAPAAR